MAERNDAFISYSRKDKEFIRILADRLDEHDITYWVDWEGIPLAADWWNEIQIGIDNADSFIFVISEDSVTSKVCRQEIDHDFVGGEITTDNPAHLTGGVVTT